MFTVTAEQNRTCCSQIHTSIYTLVHNHSENLNLLQIITTIKILVGCFIS